MHTIIIPTHGRIDSLDVMLSELPASLINTNTEILIVDNNTDPQLKNDVQNLYSKHRKICKNLKIIYSKTGLSEARHAGLKHSTGEIVTFFDDDIIVTDTWYSSIQKAFKNPWVHLVGGPCLPHLCDGPPFWFWKTFSSIDDGWVNHFYSLVDFPETKRNVNPNYIFGLNFTIRRETLIQLDGFNPDILPADKKMFQGDGETGVTKKLSEANLRADFVKDATVYHQIANNRLTREYLNHRAYFQGLIDSYATLRSKHKVSIKQLASLTVAIGLCQMLSRKNTLYNYAKGYTEHQRKYRRCSELKRWVHKVSYYDF